MVLSSTENTFSQVENNPKTLNTEENITTHQDSSAVQSVLWLTCYFAIHMSGNRCNSRDVKLSSRVGMTEELFTVQQIVVIV